MKRLALVRHAKSSWDNAALRDIDRPLNARGKRDAPIMAQVLASYVAANACWISSPAIRAQTTAHVMAEVLQKTPSAIQTEPSLYLASSEEILKVIQSQPADVAQLVLFGHNPGITDTANALANVRLDNLPTCGIFVVDFAVIDWSTIQFGMGKFIHLDYPKNY